MPEPTDNGKTYTFKIRQDAKFHDGSPLTAADVAASWNEIIFPPEDVLSPRQSHYIMVDKVEAPDPTTVTFHLKFATNAFLPALADPYSWIYQKKILDKDPRWYEKNILGSGPFKFAGYQIGQSIKGYATLTTITRDYRISTALSGSMRRNRRSRSTRSAATGRRSNFGAIRPRRSTS